MKKVLFSAAVILLAVAVVNPTFADPRQVRFVPMGPEPEATFPLTQALSVSSDGEVALVCLGFIGCGVAVWSEGQVGQFGSEYIIAESLANGLPSISDSYEVLFEPGSLGTAGIWDGVPFPNAGYDPLVPLADGFGFCGSSGQSTYAMSGDGQWATGLTWVDRDGDGSFCDPGSASAFLWNRAAGTTTVLDNSVNDNSTRGNGINADGSVVVGWGQTTNREAMKWVNGVQSFICPNAIGAGGDEFCTEGWDVSDDGQSILTSYAGPLDFNTTAAIIDPQGGVTKMDPPPFPGDPSFDSWNARALRGDGGAVVGSYGGSGFFGSPPYPTLWTRELGTIDLQVMLLGQGLDDLFFWFLTSANDISDDGTVIVGHGTNPDGWVEAWKVDLGKVSICHKPDGNPRTLNVAWDSLPSHLDHGDDLATCEFSQGNGRSRAAERLQRGARSSVNANDSVISNIAATANNNVAAGGNAYAGALPLWNSTQPTPELPRMSPEERRQRAEQLADRVRHGARR